MSLGFMVLLKGGCHWQISIHFDMLLFDAWLVYCHIIFALRVSARNRSRFFCIAKIGRGFSVTSEKEY